MPTISLKENKDLIDALSNNLAVHTHAVISETQPTTGLKDGLIWYKASADETKIYLNGSFRSVGGTVKGTLDLSGEVDATHRLRIPVGVDKFAT